MLKPSQIGLVHLYPSLAGLSETERRQIMVDTCGVYSSKQLDQGGFDLLMARLEAVLWERVDAKLCPDPRLCRVCGRLMLPKLHGRGACPEGCENRKVAAWTRSYWRGRLPGQRQANRRAIWLLSHLWKLMQDYLEPAQQTNVYLAGIVAQAAGLDAAELLEGERFKWDSLPGKVAHLAIDAMKDRLKCAVK